MTATTATLRELAGFSYVASVLAAERQVRPIMRRAVLVDGEVRLVLDPAPG